MAVASNLEIAKKEKKKVERGLERKIMNVVLLIDGWQSIII